MLFHKEEADQLKTQGNWFLAGNLHLLMRTLHGERMNVKNDALRYNTVHEDIQTIIIKEVK